jgi:hypothetical protein
LGVSAPEKGEGGIRSPSRLPDRAGIERLSRHTAPTAARSGKLRQDAPRGPSEATQGLDRRTPPQARLPLLVEYKNMGEFVEILLQAFDQSGPIMILEFLLCVMILLKDVLHEISFYPRRILTENDRTLNSHISIDSSESNRRPTTFD